jgi:hypothetical protein
VGFGGKGSRIEGTGTILYLSTPYMFPSLERGTWRNDALSHIGRYGLGTHSGLFRAG